MKHPLVKIHWRDISAGHNWLDLKESIEFGEKRFDTPCFTVGYLLHKDRKIVVLAGSYSEDEDGMTYNDVSMIPASVVVNIKKLNEKI